MNPADRLYNLLSRLGNPSFLANSTKDMRWPSQGVYFLYEAGRITHAGTHAISGKSNTSVAQRLSQLRGVGRGQM